MFNYRKQIQIAGALLIAVVFSACNNGKEKFDASGTFEADEVIVSVGGFLGMGTKLVAVPYTQLKLGDTKNASSDNKVVMPGATKESLKAQPEFKYTNRG